jgi:hypothetical protein
MLLYVLLTQQNMCIYSALFLVVHSTGTFLSSSFYSKGWLLNKLKQWRSYHNGATNSIQQRHQTVNVFRYVTFNMYSFHSFYTTHLKHLTENSVLLFRWLNCVKLKIKFHNSYDTENRIQRLISIILHTLKATVMGSWGY